MPVKKGLTYDQVAETLRKSNGNMSLAARMLKVDRATIRWYIDNYAAVREVYTEAVQHVNDIAEGHLVNAVLKGELDQVRYWLENKARDRGYGRGQNSGSSLVVTPDQLAAMSDDELTALITKMERLR